MVEFPDVKEIAIPMLQIYYTGNFTHFSVCTVVEMHWPIHLATYLYDIHICK